MALQNRVDPLGNIVSAPQRGTLMGNRGGCLHDGARRLGRRRWVSKAWIACVLDFRGRHRTIMTPGRYTELFFLDEATALAAGHRPCFECRRGDARAFAQAWAQGNWLDAAPRAGEMDAVLHGERIGRGRLHPTHRLPADDLPDGTIVLLGAVPHLLAAGAVRQWSFAGYGSPIPLPGMTVDVVTPPSVVRTLAAGYRPVLHPSAHRPA
jgi:hypothetical protein